MRKFELAAEHFAELTECEEWVRWSEAWLDRNEARAEPEWTRRAVPHSAGVQSSQVPADRDARQLPAPSQYDRN